MNDIELIGEIIKLTKRLTKENSINELSSVNISSLYKVINKELKLDDTKISDLFELLFRHKIIVNQFDAQIIKGTHYKEINEIKNSNLKVRVYFFAEKIPYVIDNCENKSRKLQVYQIQALGV